MGEPARVAKLSVSVPPTLAAEVRAHVGPGGLSSFTARALRHELDREKLAAFLQELEREIGAPDPALVAEIDKLWPDT